MIEEILENFPFEYKNYLIEDEFLKILKINIL